MTRSSLARPLGLLALAAAVAAGCSLDEAELARPGSEVITADVGQLRVLAYDVDPAVDDWIDVLEPDPAVVTEVGTFREDDGARLADDGEAGDRRRLFEASGAGRTLLVELNCGPSPCDGSGPEPAVHVWEFSVAGGERLITRAEPIRVAVGERFVLAAPDAGPYEIVAGDADAPDPVRHVVAYDAEDPAAADVDVFIAVRTGSVQVRDAANDRVHDVEVIDA